MTDRPNILVIMTDQQRATASHLYGNSCCQTPAMARLADQGVLYQNAITPHPLCVPGRISFWTSQYPHSHGGRRKMVRTREWKYVHDPMGDRDELYDLANDPWELENIVDEEANRDVLAEMQLRLADWSIGTEDSPPLPLPDASHYNPS